MRKFLHITEYFNIPNKLPIKRNNEHSFKLDDKIFYTSVVTGDDYATKEQIKESYKNDTIYNDSIVDTTILPLDRVIIFDDLDIDPAQKIVYVFECPICLYTVITSNKDFDFCPQCENTEFPFILKALINTEQMEELAIDNSDITTLVIVKDGTIKLVCEPEPEKEKEYLNA